MIISYWSVLLDIEYVGTWLVSALGFGCLPCFVMDRAWDDLLLIGPISPHKLEMMLQISEYLIFSINQIKIHLLRKEDKLTYLAVDVCNNPCIVVKWLWNPFLIKHGIVIASFIWTLIGRFLFLNNEDQ